jgi:hypothetical protein
MNAPASRAWRARLALAALALVALLALPSLATWLAAVSLRAAARPHRMTLAWSHLEWRPPLTFRLRDLSVADAGGTTLAAAESLSVTLDGFSLLLLHPRPASLSLAHASVRWRSSAGADADTLIPDEERPAARARTPDRAPRVRATARSVASALLIPARRLPRLEVRDLDIFGREERALRVHLARLSLAGARGEARLSGSGELTAGQRIPFEGELAYDRNDRLEGHARFELDSPTGGPAEAFSIGLSGRVTQDRHRGIVSLGDSTRLELGHIPVRLSGRMTRAEPRFSFALDATGLSPEQCRTSAPRALLGPLQDLAVAGRFDYTAALDLDFSRPDSVRLEADVTPHGLALDRARTRLAITALDQPFTAHIHLPHDRIELRDLSAANPHFVPLAELDSTLVHAVLINEDGAFFLHHGFNLPAVRRSIADNIHAAGWRRGAGTITMQLVRNLYLGHERTLSRKGQEVVLAWVLEHLTGVSKSRMLEIYLNIIEWSPASCGADEAAHYYFGHDARRVSLEEALFLATVLPAPEKWRYRFASDGSLRPFERAQMHFIGRAMVNRGWLDERLLPPTDSLRLELRGPARATMTGPGGSAALDSPPGPNRGASASLASP